MTREELLAWGKRESSLRKADLRQVTSAEGLRAAQDAASGRRRAVGLSRGEAARWVAQSQRGASS